MFSTKPSRLLAIWLVLFLAACSEDDPIQYGDDGALLTQINIGSSVALISRVTSNDLIEAGGHTYFNEQLLTVSAAGATAEAELTIFGQGNGFDKYTLNDLNDKHFLISFNLRKESYFVDKKNGIATKSVYVNTENLSMNDAYNSMHPYGFYGVRGNDFYFKDSDEQWFHVSNFLSESATPEPITFDKFPEKLFFDSKGGIYFTSQYSLYYSSNGVSKLVVTDHVGLFNSRDGKLKVVTEDGKVSNVLDGVMTPAFTVPGSVYPWHRFNAFHFSELGKSLAIYTQKVNGKTMLYDLDGQTNKMELVRNGNPLYIISADVYKKFLMILHEYNGKKMLRVIDVEINKIDDVDVTGLEVNDIEHFYAIAETLMVVDVCRPEPGGVCHKDIKVLTTSGAAKSVAGGSTGGKIIPLN